MLSNTSFSFARCIAALILLLAITVCEARTNNYCSYQYLGVTVYGGKAVTCGGHEQPACNSGAACNANHISWSGDPFPYTITCPTVTFDTIFGERTVNVADVTINSGCYDEVPTCNSCGGNGQPPCPENTGLSCEGCDSGTSLNAQTGLCLSPSTVGALCDIDVGCAEGLLCDTSSSQCFTEAQAGESCLGLPCANGLQCTLALECSHAPRALEGETCDITAPCADGLYCALGLPQRCRAKAKPLESCDPSLPNSCVDGSFCLIGSNSAVCAIDPFAADLTVAQCTDMYSSRVKAQRDYDPLFSDRTMTYGSGIGAVGGIGTSLAQGVIYSQDGDFGCYNAQCLGIDVDASVEAFISNGTYDDYDAVAGESVVVVAEGQLPGSVVNVGVGTAFTPGFEENIGTEAFSGIGVGVSPFPVSAGLYECFTGVIEIYSPPSGGGAPPPPVVIDLPGPAQPPLSPFGAVELSNGLAVGDPSDQAALAASNPATVAMWVRVTEDTGDAVLLDNPGRYRLSLNDDELRITLGNADAWGSYNFDTGVTSLREQLWTHMAISMSDTTMTVYVNGAMAASFTGIDPLTDALPAQNTWTLGRAYDGSEPLTGAAQSVGVWSTALNGDQVRAAMLEGDRVATDSLVAYFGLGDLPGAALTDFGPNAVALTTLDGDDPATTRQRPAVLGGALHFDGVNEMVAIDDPAALEGLIMTLEVTLEAWVFPTGPGSQSVFGGTIAGKDGSYYIARNVAGELFYALDNDSPGWVSVNTGLSLPEYTWTHVALTYSSSTQQVLVYLNGELAYSDTGSGALGSFLPELDQFRIGGRENDERTGASARMAFDGLIDEVRVWRVAQTAADIAANFDQPLNSDEWPQLAGYWRFDEADSAVALDSSGNAAHARLGRGVRWRYPQRVDAGVYDGYPRGLLQGACTDNDCSVDYDNDGVSDYTDNCLATTNPEQRDADLDGFGNLCDADFNNDDIVNVVDLGYLRSVFFTDDLLADLNGDGVVNVVDLGLLRSLFFQAPGPGALR